MDYIQKAIDKARAERKEHDGDEKTRPEEAGQAAPRKDVVRNNAELSSGINYTVTRQETVDEAVLRNNRIVAGFNFDPEAEPYRQLRTQILRKLRANNWRTLAITSPTPGDGKTVTALNLAISMSQEVNQTVLLVDLDLRGQSILNVLGLETGKGITDHLFEDCPISQILVNPGYERLVILPSKPESYSSELLSTPKMRDLLSDLTSRYESRLLIFDLPPLLVNDDALVFVPYVDATLLVVEDGKTSEDDLKRCMRLLEDANLIGSVLNKAGQ